MLVSQYFDVGVDEVGAAVVEDDHVLVVGRLLVDAYLGHAPDCFYYLPALVQIR
mgnify:CR=1 FL=1